MSAIDFIEYAVAQKSFTLCTPQGGTLMAAPQMFLRHRTIRERFLHIHPAVSASSFMVSKAALDGKAEPALAQVSEIQTKINSGEISRPASGVVPEFREAVLHYAHLARLQEIFSPLDGCSLQLSLQDRPRNYSDVENPRFESVKPDEMSDRDILQEIIGLARSGERLTRD
ncbi:MULTISPECIES: hypothetical protein [Mameliella]|uniref:hypothetical protein n=1 Tax=Mameliella TaxID=1434019 RepID=UPI0011120396|nr:MULTISPECIES: hypothetical protein [Mameliella]MDD9728314.1 hypothetical protein [Mameliella sp. AT18]